MLRSMIPLRVNVPASFTRFENDLDQMMGRWLNPSEGDEGAGSRFTPALNLSETENSFEISVELPGLNPEDVKLEFNEGDLWITGQKSEEKEETGKAYHRIERHHGEFRRVIRLPGKIDQEKVEASYKQGVLHVSVPKSEEVKPKQIPIKSE